MRENTKVIGRLKLLPPDFLAVLFPLLTYVKIEASPYAAYAWGDHLNDKLDFFAYGKAVCMIILACICLLLFIWRCLSGVPVKKLPPYVPLLFLALWCVFLSAFLSDDHQLSLWRGNDSRETAFIWAAYLIVFLYTCQIIDSKEDILHICKALLAGLCLVLLVGLPECAGFPLIEQDWWQRIFLGKYYAEYAGEIVTLHAGNVSATFGNPDLAGAYLSILFPIPLMLMKSASKRWQKVFLSAIWALDLLEMIKTGYRGVFPAVGGALLLMLPIWIRFLKERGNQKSIRIAGLCCIALVVFGIADVFLNLGILSGVTDDRTPLVLSDLSIRDDHIVLQTKESSALISFENNTYKIEIAENDILHDVTASYDPEEEILDYPGYEDLILCFTESEDSRMEQSVKIIDGYCRWHFCLKNGTFVYQNSLGKTDTLDVAKTAFDPSYDYVGSGRIYIWSRTIPLLKDCLLTGKGACMFAAVFPQSDYMAKAKAFGMNNLIISEVDNIYMNMWLEHGLPMCLCMVFFCVKIILSVYPICDIRHGYLATGLLLCVMIFLVNGFFICFSITVTPIAVVLAALLTAYVQIAKTTGTSA